MIMLKDLNKGNWIIPPWDKRYGKLGHIWNYYKYDDLIRSTEYKAYQYYIIPELVNNIYESSKNYITSDLGDPNLYAKGTKVNWIDSRSFNRIIEYTTDLTPEQYYLLVNGYNNIHDYTRCAYCKVKLTFTNFLRGYNSPGRYIGDLIGKITCSQSCLMYYKNRTPEVYHNIGFRNQEVNSKTKRSWFLNKGNLNDECYLYVTKVNDKLKFGITSDPDQREYRYLTHEHSPNKLEIIIVGSRLYIANLELLIKRQLNYSEYIELDYGYYNLIELIKEIKSKYDNNQLTID